MKILILTQHWYPDTFGGSEHVAMEQARRLAKRGHEVVVLTHYLQAYLPPEEEIPFTSPFGKGGQRGILRIIRYGQPEQFKKWGASLTDLRLVPKEVRRLQKIYHFEQAILHHAFPAYGFFRARIKIPALYIFHASTAREAEVEGLRRQFHGFWKLFAPLFVKIFIYVTRFIEKRALNKSQRVALFSDYSLKILQETYPQKQDKIIKISLGINSAFFAPPENKNEAKRRLGFGPDRPLLLTVRRLTARMGLSELLAAMVMLKKDFPQIILLLVGEGPLKEKLIKEIEQKGLRGTAVFMGRLPLADLPLYYQAADLFVLPTAAFEGLGMATLEALSCGLPVLGTPVGATPEILNKLDKSLITKSPAAEDLVQGIKNFLTRPESEKLSLSPRARQLVLRDYDWDKAVEELEKILSSLITKRIWSE